MNKPFLTVLTALTLLGSGLAQEAQYTVQKGDTAFSIARRHGLSLEQLLTLNGLSDPALRTGQVLRLVTPAAQEPQQTSPAPEVQPGRSSALSITIRAARLPQFGAQSVASAPRIVPPAGTPTDSATPLARTQTATHTVQRGETAYGIARLYGLSVERLLSLNGLGSSELSAGQVLEVTPAAGVARSGSAPRLNTVSLDLAAASVRTQTYRVQRGESLFMLAKRFGTSVTTLQELNNLTSSELSVDLELIVPGVTEGQPEPSLPDPEAAPLEPGLGASGWRQKALSLLGVPYVYGGKSERGTDCSGFVIQVMDELGLSLPRRSVDQFAVGTSVSRENLREGDLVFFDTTGNGVSHVGIYLGEGKFINANSYMAKVVVDELGSSYWAPRYLGARRVMREVASR